MGSDDTKLARRFAPLTTERLVIRAPVASDLAELAARRNHPDVALYQHWPTPQPLEQTRKGLDAAIEQGGLLDDEWWMMTVALHDGTVVGDLATGISWGWRAAEVGYSFSPAFWGRGYAAEALHRLLDHLFDDHGIHRASATLHPDNVASAMLLERAGFTFEGQTKLSFWVGDENSDDGLYGMTSADRTAWLARPTGPADQVRLVDITAQNQRVVSELATHHSQKRMVATVLESFADAMFPGGAGDRVPVPRMWAIEADGELAGFMMIAEQTATNPDPYLWRLLIDRRFQRRGIGSRAVELLADHCRAAGASAITVSWEEGKGSPEPFYLAHGYVPTGAISDGEVEARKQL